MRKRHLAIAVAAGAACALGGALAAPSGAGDAAAPERADAAALYDRLCLACHGVTGDGGGPAAPWLWPRPRDFTRGAFKWRTTPSGQPPTDADLELAIRRGAPGTSMHGFGDTLTGAQIAALAGHVRDLAGSGGPAPDAVAIPDRPPVTPEALARGERLFAELGCAQCHGEGGAGDGPSASALRDAAGRPAPPFDLTREPLRRPRRPGEPGIVSIYKTLATGLSGTPMPAYAGTVPDRDLWAVAAYVDDLRFRGSPDPEDAVRTHPIARRLDRGAGRARAGHWPGSGAPAEARVFGNTIPLQGEPPASLAPAQASLDADRCARCHKKQVREWRGSIHAGASSPGVIAQLLGMARRKDGAAIESCQRCHAPLAEALPAIRPGHRGGDDGSRDYAENPAFDPQLRDQGLNCASCHVRGWRRHGPPAREGSGLLALPGYPVTELAIYERSDFCLPCHQLTPRSSKLDGKPLLNTYREWLEGPYMRRGVQCQHCHMPNREHTFKGVHDPDTFRQGIDLTATAARSRRTGAVSVRARLANVGAGHYLPTTPTPAAWLKIWLVDERGEAIEGAFDSLRIGRHLVYDGGFRELEDTRIPPGETAELAAAWKRGRVPEATHAEIAVIVWPDEYYERFYRRRLRGELPARERALYRAALERAEGSHYVALRRRVPVN